MEYIYYAFAAILIFFSFKSLVGGIAYLNYFKTELAKPPSDFTPFASIIVPCKGLDDGLKENLSSLLKQNYPCYEVIFVVDDANDEAVRMIEEVSRVAAMDTRLVIAAKSTESSQKIENLREAILRVNDLSRVFVFVDSDIRPGTLWLGSLIAPLADENVGASTGYRWFISKAPNFASEMLSVWNASIASALGPNAKSNFCWGGSTAVRRDTFDELDIRERWRGSLSDDFMMTRAMNEADLPIFFVPKALSASIPNCTFSRVLEFTTRQMKISRVYASKLWVTSFLGSGLFILVMIWAILIVFQKTRGHVSFWIAIVVLATSVCFGTGKSWLRLKAVRLALPEHEQDLGRQFFVQNTFWLLTPALFFYNSIAALFSRKIAWRGIFYEMISTRETKVISRSGLKIRKTERN